MIIKANAVVDAKGLACPMPIVRTKKAMNDLHPGSVMEVQATDKGSTADIRAWSESAGHQYLGTVEEGGTLKHYLRKSRGAGLPEKRHPHVASNEQLVSMLGAGEPLAVLDVRESAEYCFGHIPGALSIPLGELEARLGELNREHPLYVVCRTGSRSDLAAQQLTAAGFTQVINVVPGMSEWPGEQVNAAQS
ncbi:MULTISPECIES: sulfurtransferase TusA family protein [Paenibacillus]|uniref:sulfurtransferase TusA family protein n=1 Tax=Paenibacillus TaxID=44249 RepID=UPI0022B876B6|nr:sulfurtransferase TusA family protein [Paenibacillus caseinilyticus]MCZ8518237.1 sulfurtransferase TusA family protein [Paenibacillus caseinilyticus]